MSSVLVLSSLIVINLFHFASAGTSVHCAHTRGLAGLRAFPRRCQIANAGLTNRQAFCFINLPVAFHSQSDVSGEALQWRAGIRAAWCQDCSPRQ